MYVYACVQSLCREGPRYSVPKWCRLWTQATQRKDFFSISLAFALKVKGSVEIDQEKIFQDSQYDGLYGVCSNIETKSSQETIRLYRSLWRIEELFRINKHTLKMRPIYHRLPNRIKAHILICFLAYAVLKKTELSVAVWRCPRFVR